MISYNIGNAKILFGLISILTIEKPQLIMLQEVTLSSDQLSSQVAKYGYKAECNIDMANPTALGTAIVWQSHLKISDIFSVVECRGQSLTMGPYTFLNLYAPSGSQNRQQRRDFFGQDIFRLVRSCNSGSLPIIGGDFNCILSAKDTERNFADKRCPALKDLVDSFNYTDAYRFLYPAGQEYTFHRQSCSASRLDRFYIPQDLLHSVSSVSHQASLGDHFYTCIVMEVQDLGKKLDLPIFSSSYWKLNTSILKDEDFLENFSCMYSKLQARINDYPDIADWWDLCAKPNIKDFCMGVSSHLANITRDTKKFLFSYLNVVIKQGN